MVGHLYKDFKVAWMTFFFLGAILAFVGILAVSMLGQSGVNAANEEMENVITIFGGLALLNMTAPLVAMYEVAASDEKERWADFVMALPGGIKTYVKSKYVFILLVSLLAAACTHVFCIVTGAFWDNPLWNQAAAYGEGLIIGAALGLGMLAAAFFFPFVFRFGIRLGNVISNVLLFCLVFGFYIFFMFGDVEMLENALGNILSYLISHYRLIAGVIKALLPIGLAAMLGSCVLSVRVCRQGVARHEYWE